MKNIAFLIGISDYNREQALPACRLDVQRIKQLLEATDKYAEISTITENVTASRLKDALRSFFVRFKEDQINEAFVYFSGHGSFNIALDEVFLCCKDYDTSKPGTTSLSNSEIDDLLRLVSPQVAVKIVDACNSGVPYIKDVADGFQKALEKSTKGLNSFYCMASSRLDQSSFCDADASYFTKQFIGGALSRADGSILYRDIQAFVADAFIGKSNQTPHFVSQGNGLESFSVVTEQMKLLAAPTAPVVSGPATTGLTRDSKDVFDEAVTKRDALFVPLEGITKALEESQRFLSEAKIPDEVLVRFYKLEASFEGKLANLPKIRQIAATAQEKQWDKQYFVSIDQEQYAQRVRVEPSMIDRMRLISSLEVSEPRYETRAASRPSSLTTTQSLPFEKCQIVFQPVGRPSLKPFCLFIGLVFSRTEVLVLSALARYVEAGWDKYAVDDSSVEWQQQMLLWRDVVQDSTILFEKSFQRAIEAIRKELNTLIAEPATGRPAASLTEEPSQSPRKAEQKPAKVK